MPNTNFLPHTADHMNTSTTNTTTVIESNIVAEIEWHPDSFYLNELVSEGAPEYAIPEDGEMAFRLTPKPSNDPGVAKLLSVWRESYVNTDGEADLALPAARLFDIEVGETGENEDGVKTFYPIPNEALTERAKEAIANAGFKAGLTHMDPDMNHEGEPDGWFMVYFCPDEKSTDEVGVLMALSPRSVWPEHFMRQQNDEAVSMPAITA